MADDKQTQKAGDNSQQFQANTIILNQGIDEKRAREIYIESFEIAKRDLTQEAIACATERVQQLEECFMSRIKSIEGAINSFSDPAFQVLLTNAQRTAVATERENDYGMLAELLVCHIEKGNKRKTRAGISKAVEIIDKIDDDALCALTVLHAIEQFRPIAPTSKQGLNTLSSMFDKIIYMPLPTDNSWIEHLEILDTIRINSMGHFLSLEEFYSKVLEGYTLAGIRKDSDKYKQVTDLLLSINLTPSLLVNNDYLPNYVKLPIISKSQITDLKIVRNATVAGQVLKIEKEITDDEKKVLESIFDLYDKDTNINKQSLDAFMNEYHKHDSLSRIAEWWEELKKLSFSFNLTHVGIVLAHTNARRCDKTLPDLPLNL
jgi:hypothetical protein